MRQLKFRLYHQESGEMVYFDLGDADLKALSSDDRIWEIDNIADHRIMQWTGLCDKDHNDIYEGDILSDWVVVDDELVQPKLQVYWCNDAGAWKLDNSFNQDKSSGDLLSSDLADFDYEITGNIYQKMVESPKEK